MLIYVAIIVCGCLMIYVGTRGFTEKGLRFSAKTTLVGKSGRILHHLRRGTYSPSLCVHRLHHQPGLGTEPLQPIAFSTSGTCNPATAASICRAILMYTLVVR